MNAFTELGTQTRIAEDAPILRVLSGRSNGAEHRLPLRRKLIVGHSFESDIVLRDRSTRGCALELVIGARRPVLKVIAGSVTMLGRSLVPGDEIQLEPYLPIAMGDIHFAIGGSDDVRWEEAARSAVEMPDDEFADEECQPTDLVERLELRTQVARSRVSEMSPAPKRLAIVGAALLAIAAGSHFGDDLTAKFEAGPSEIGSQLESAGYPMLSVEAVNGGAGYRILGLVRDEQTAANLREWVAANHPSVMVEVETLVSAAAAASDLLAAQGIDATARMDGNSGLVIEGPFLPQDRQQELADLLRKDLPRVGKIAFSANAGRGENDLAYFFNAPGYGAASFVAGDPGYLVTEDGTRWFAGASLPTGHRIIEIGEGSVTVERDGLRDILRM